MTNERSSKKHYRLGLFISLIMFFTIIGAGCSNEADSKQPDSSSSAKVVKKTKYVGKDKYTIAKKENVALLAKEKKLSEQADDLESQKDKIASDEAAAKQKEQEEQAAAQKQQEEQAKAAQKQQEQATQQSSGQTRGDMNTSGSGQIVGNSNSHIYHVPGQRGYNMNSSNAVYFNNEQDAINAGYRRSKV